MNLRFIDGRKKIAGTLLVSNILHIYQMIEQKIGMFFISIEMKQY